MFIFSSAYLILIAPTPPTPSPLLLPFQKAIAALGATTERHNFSWCFVQQIWFKKNYSEDLGSFACPSPGYCTHSSQLGTKCSKRIFRRAQQGARAQQLTSHGTGVGWGGMGWGTASGCEHCSALGKVMLCQVPLLRDCCCSTATPFSSHYSKTTGYVQKPTT